MLEIDLQAPFTKVWARNFRSIEYAELELEALTVLVGPNASGKSNLLDIFGFLADAIRHSLETAITRRGGIDSIGRKSPTGRILGPEIGFQHVSSEETLEYSVSMTRVGRGDYRVKREHAKLQPTDSGVAPFELELTNGRLTKPNLKRFSRRTAHASEEDSEQQPDYVVIINRMIEELDNQDLNLISAEHSQITSFISLVLSRSNDTVGSNVPLDRSSFHLHLALNKAKENLGRIGIYHLFPNSLRDPQKVADSHPLAAEGENLASTLRDMLQKKNRFLPELKAALTVAVPGVRDIRVSSAGSYYVVELKHEREGGTERGSWFDLSHESDGTIRLLAMLTALFQDPAPSLIGLEEPELAIHPGAMSVLSDTMQEASTRGQVLVATHSPELINSLPIDSIRAVTAEDGSTRVGGIADHQLKSIQDQLFMPGEIHSMEGLVPAVSAP